MTVVIPAYDPDEQLLKLLPELHRLFPRIVLVDDGSVRGREVIAAAAPYVSQTLVHPVNRGKGAALKTAFAALGDEDVITVDADGQHSPADVRRIAEALQTHRGGLVLGTRCLASMPFRSWWGNAWTCMVFFLFTGLWVRDTQTGLRGIPAGLLRRVAALPGDRYEYEMAMLADARLHPERPLQLPITTIYREGNASSHFSPLRDTVRIFAALVRSRM